MRHPYAKYYGSKEKERKSSGRISITGLDISQGEAGEGILGRWKNLSKGPEVGTTWGMWGCQKSLLQV